MKYLFLIGRILFASVFILKGIDHFSKEAIHYASTMNVPAPSILVPISGILALLGGLSLLFGYKAKFGALLLVLFLLPTTFFMHPFWNFVDHYHVLLNQFCFFKNLSLLGSCLMITYFGSGPFSLSKD